MISRAKTQPNQVEGLVQVQARRKGLVRLLLSGVKDQAKAQPNRAGGLARIQPSKVDGLLKLLGSTPLVLVLVRINAARSIVPAQPRAVKNLAKASHSPLEMQVPEEQDMVGAQVTTLKIPVRLQSDTANIAIKKQHNIAGDLARIRPSTMVETRVKTQPG
jgi:hypothetical protein